MPSYEESELLPLSALQHLLFCERQCALIHIERVWRENVLTLQGRLLHKKVHRSFYETKANVTLASSLAIRSFALGLAGQADLVEFHYEVLRNRIVTIVPVEYKRGRAKKDLSDKIQLCAQAMCLEEMIGKPVHEGALFYGRTRKRLVVPFDQALRVATAKAALRLHTLIDAGQTPRPRYDSRCRACSLFDICLPRTLSRNRSVGRYIKHALVTDRQQDIGDDP